MSFEPVGASDRRLLEQVRPSGWTNPEPAGRYDLLVVGGGTGGLVSAAIARALGGKVALIERALLGGDCLNYGCVPSKGVLRAARAWAEARNAREIFGGPAVSGPGDFAAAMERMRGLRAHLSDADGAARFAAMGVDLYFGEARFTGAATVVVEGAELTFRRAIVATGARAAVPPIPGLADVGYLTNETVFQLTTLPGELLVLGAGPIGVELSWAFAQFGARVTLLDLAERPLPREEPEASGVALEALRRAGVRFVGGVRITRVEEGRRGRKSVWFELDGEERSAEGDALLVALGRTPNVDVDLERAGIEFGRGGIRVDDRLRTTNPRVYAVGDVAGPLQFTHVADAQARIAVRNALFFGRGRASRLLVPAATYLHPEVARVGPTRAELDAEGTAFDSVWVGFDQVDRAVLEGETEGFLLVHLALGGDRILGATLVAPGAGDIISQVTQAIVTGTGLLRLGDLIYPYPTLAESLRKAADARRREKLTPAVRRFFQGAFRLTRRLP